MILDICGIVHFKDYFLIYKTKSKIKSKTIQKNFLSILNKVWSYAYVSKLWFTVHRKVEGMINLTFMLLLYSNQGQRIGWWQSNNNFWCFTICIRFLKELLRCWFFRLNISLPSASLRLQGRGQQKLCSELCLR